MADLPLIDTATLEKLERLTIHWKKSLPGLIGGHRASRFGGPGQEFLDHRHFHHGDDLRAVNWRAFLRLEKLFLKMFQLEPRIPVRLLIDVSGSMVTGVGAQAKFDYVRRLAAALCYVGLVRLDAMCLQPFSDKLGDAFVAGGGRHRFMPAVHFLSRLKPEGPTKFLEVARDFVSKYPQRGLLIILSDFMDDVDCEKPLQYLGEFGHELLLVQIWADEDRTPPWEGELDLEDAETGRHLELSFDANARQAYTEAFDAYSEKVEKMALRNGGRYVGLPASTSIEDAIFGSLARAGVID